MVKSLKSNAPQEEKIKLLQEAAIMGQFHHPNILQFYGVVNEEPTVSISTSRIIMTEVYKIWIVTLCIDNDYYRVHS